MPLRVLDAVLARDAPPERVMAEARDDDAAIAQRAPGLDELVTRVEDEALDAPAAAALLGQPPEGVVAEAQVLPDLEAVAFDAAAAGASGLVEQVAGGVPGEAFGRAIGVGAFELNRPGFRGGQLV